MAKEVILTKERLGYYDTKLKAWVTTADEEILKQAKAYAEGLGGNYDTAGTAQTKVDELANGQVKTNKEAIDAINNAETGILKQAKDYADGKDEAIATAKKAGDDAQADVNALAEKVGTVPEGQSVMGIITNIQENVYDDTAIKELIQGNADEIVALKVVGAFIVTLSPAR